MRWILDFSISIFIYAHLKDHLKVKLSLIGISFPAHNISKYITWLAIIFNGLRFVVEKMRLAEPHPIILFLNIQIIW